MKYINGKIYVYVFVRKDLPANIAIVQTSHACIEIAKAFLTNETEHPHLVLLGVENEAQIYKVAQRLDIANIQYRIFIEPDRNGEATSLATEVIRDEKRQIFKRYQCLKG